jgi:crossover junction endodeoxyribonuclease RuvC
LFFRLEIHQDNPAFLVDDNDAVGSGIDQSTKYNTVLVVVQIFSDQVDSFSGTSVFPRNSGGALCREDQRITSYGRGRATSTQDTLHGAETETGDNPSPCFVPTQRCTKKWRAFAVRRKIAAMNAASISRETRMTKDWMRVLGVDPAAAGPTGYGIVESNGQECRMLHYGALKVTAKHHKEGDGAALREVHALLCGLIQEFAPDVMAVESIFSALNVRTALRLAEVRGVVLLAAAQHGVEVHSYAPREVKATIAGHGHADKRQMQIMVRAILSMSATPEPPDAADALAVALCHLQMEQARRRFGLPAEKELARPRSLAAVGNPGNAAGAVRVNRATRGAPPRILTA